MNNPTPITIRRLKSLDDFYHFQELQRRIWSSGEDDVIPIHVLVTQAKNGGLLQGAFAAEGAESTGGMVGMAFGWPGFDTHTDPPSLKFCSHIAGVLTDWHGRGIGLALKLAQREHLLAEGLMDWMTWTYDPLQRVNALFNIHRLRATCTTYHRDVYGPMDDALNAGLPTDRCQVEWRMDSERVNFALSSQKRLPVWDGKNIEIGETRPLGVGGRVRIPVESRLRLDGRPVAIPIPDSLAGLRAEGRGLLVEWRLFQRELIEAAFARGYEIVDCVELFDIGVHYILTPAGVHPFADMAWP
jgi:predicted GNAT superfamily acetyltransferase